MKKLIEWYRRSELLFSLGAILIYLLPLSNLRGLFGLESPWSLLLLLLFSGGLLFFIRKNGLSAKFGLTSWPWGREVLWEIPFLLLASVNLLGGVQSRYDFSHLLWVVLSMALAGFVEEILFRGLLFRALERKNPRWAMIVSALTFGFGHLLNLLNGAPILDTGLQVICAIVLGYAFVIFFHRTGSLLPCIAAHGLINVLSIFSNEASLSPAMHYILIPLFLIAVSLAYVRWMNDQYRKNGGCP